MYRFKDDKYYAVGGTKGYRWLESEVVKNNHMEDDINLDYYRELATKAINDISQFGDFDWFVNGKPEDYFLYNVKDTEDGSMPFKESKGE